jgi:SPP1 gp7 family putative phage head morphogenesis protein
MALSRVLPPELQRSRWRPTIAERRLLLRQQQHFERVRRAERGYAARLRAIARNVGHLISAFTPGDSEALPEMLEMLNRYSYIIRPWARATALRMIAEVTRRDATAWFRTSREIGVNLREMIENAPIGGVIQQMLDDQVDLITSLPREAGQRVQQYTQEFVAGGRRYDDLVQLIRDSGNVTTNRAALIARTETAKAQSAIVQARSQHIGSDTYIWRTVRDNAVRREHRQLEGTLQRWDAPPVAEASGERHHPGNFPNCRCFAEPVLPAVIM